MKKTLILFIFISSSLFSQKERWNNASKELVDLYKSAYEKYRKNDIQESINDLTIAIEIDSNYRSAYAFRGQLYKSQKLYSKAKCVMLKPFSNFTIKSLLRIVKRSGVEFKKQTFSLFFMMWV